MPSPARGATAFDYVRFVSVGDTRTWCKAAAGDPAAFDVTLLKGRFDVEARVAAPFLDGGLNLISVIDTGIASVDTAPFARFLRANPRELRGRPGDDDDYNGFIDDLYGINFNPGSENGSVLCYRGLDPDFDHGTKVGTIVLGGQAWLTEWPAERGPWAQLKIVNFSSATEAHPVDAIYLAEAIRYLLRLDVRVVNMSLENRQPIDGMREAIGDATRTLFVTAAGNTAGGHHHSDGVSREGGGELGQLHSVLLTVERTRRAARGPASRTTRETTVDLLAPGCNVPTLKVDGTPVSESGTSIATAFASFAAGLLGALGETDGRALKNRLLVSVDVDLGLESRARLLRAAQHRQGDQPVDRRHREDRPDAAVRVRSHRRSRRAAEVLRRQRPEDAAGRDAQGSSERDQPRRVLTSNSWSRPPAISPGSTARRTKADQSIGSLKSTGEQVRGPIARPTCATSFWPTTAGGAHSSSRSARAPDRRSARGMVIVQARSRMLLDRGIGHERGDAHAPAAAGATGGARARSSSCEPGS